MFTPLPPKKGLYGFDVMRNMKVIKASAGSGKTYTLAQRYIEQLLWATDPVTGKKSLRKGTTAYHEHILAITFTNKATDEMKGRIVEELYLLARGEGGYLQGFCDKYQESADGIQQAAGAALESILFNYSTFNVSTIDSFFQVIMRTFARELDRDYNYEIQLDDNFAISQSVHDFMLSLGNGAKMQSQLDRWVKDFIQEEINNKGDWNFFGNRLSERLVSFSSIISKELFREHHDEIKTYLSDLGNGSGVSRINQFKKKVGEAHAHYKKACDGFGDEVRAFLDAHSLNDNNLKRSGIVTLYHHGTLSDSQVATLHGYVDNGLSMSEKVIKKADLATLSEAERAEFDSLLPRFIESYDRERALATLLSHIWQLGLLGHIDQKLEQFRKDNNSILLADTNELIAKVLDSGVDFVYERVGTWIHHFMIDEFQDTSRKQYSNFKPLLDESLSRGNENLIIGDEKQSIYRFRNSDPDLLQSQLGKDFDEAFDDSTKLNTNYRSFEHIIGFNNAFFEQLVHYYNASNEYPKLGTTYENLKQAYSGRYDSTGKHGYVKVEFIYTGRKKDMPKRTDASGNELEGKNQVLDRLPGQILRLKNEQKFAFGDMLILVNDHADGNAVVERLLKHNAQAQEQEHINIVSSESLLLKNSPAVRLIVSVLRFVDATQYYSTAIEEQDAQVEKTPVQRLMERRLKEQARYKALHDFGKKVGTAPEGSDLGALLVETFAQNREEIKDKSIEEKIEAYARELADVLPNRHTEMTNLVGLVDKIIQKYLIEAGMVQDSETAFLLAFQNVVLEFTEQHSSGGTVHELLKYWDSKKEKLSIPSASDDDAIKVMTIHASKGLEAPCVLIPFADWGMIQPDSLVWVERKHWLGANKGLPFLGIDKDSDGETCLVPPLIPLTSTFLDLVSEFHGYRKTLNQENLIDKINKTYVAFTRPRQSLYINALVSDTTGDTAKEKTTIGNLLYSLLMKTEGVKSVKWKDSQPGATNVGDEYLDFCELGVEEEYYKQASGEGTLHAVEAMPRYVVHSALSRLEVKLPDLMPDEATDEGIRLHRLFSYVRDERDVERAMHLAQKHHLLSNDAGEYWTLSRVEQVMNKMLLDTRTRDWFSVDNKVYNERPFMKPKTEKGRVVAERPDRVVMRPNGEVWVIDYKFGESNTRSLTARYTRQVQRYMRLLREAGYGKVKGFLWWVRLDEVMPINEKGENEIKFKN